MDCGNGNDQDNGTDLIGIIQRFLENHGWEPQSGSGWVDHLFDNGNGEQHIEYLPNSTRLSFLYESETHEGLLSIDFDDQLDAVLAVIARHQDDLSEADWGPFIADLLGVSSRVAAHAGEDGDEVTVVRTPEDGVRMLLEI